MKRACFMSSMCLRKDLATWPVVHMHCMCICMLPCACGLDPTCDWPNLCICTCTWGP